MAQLLAGGIIALGLLIIATAIFLARRENNAQALPAATPKPEQSTTTTTTVPTTTEAKEVLSPTPSHSELQVASVPALQQTELKEAVVTEDALSVSEQNDSVHVVRVDTSLPVWWHEQFDSLTMQVQELREHASDVERQIVILGEIATLATELETLQRKRTALSEGKISLFPMKVNRQPTDVSYNTDKRPAVRKYTIKAI